MASTGDRWAAGGDLREAATRIGGAAVWLGSFALAAYTLHFYVTIGQVGGDAHAYWHAGRVAHPYGPGPGEMDAYLYTPLFAQLMRPLALLPFPAFLGLWMLAETATFYWLVKPLPWLWRVPVLLFAAPEIILGNIYAFLAAAAVLGLRYPSVWAFPLLTKIASALPGLVWFAVRGEWRKVAHVAVVSSILVAASFALDPNLWVEWARFLLSHGGQPGWMWLRLLGVVAVVAFAASRDWSWVLPGGVLLCAPMWAGQTKDLSVLLGMPRLAASSTSRPTAEARPVVSVAAGRSA